MNTILVTAIGSFSAGVVIQKLKEMNFRVVGCDIYPREWVANSLDVDSFYNVPLAYQDNYIGEIKEICTKEKIDYLIPSTDVEIDVLNKNRDIFRRIHTCLCLSSESVISLCRDKYRTYLFLHERGIECLIKSELCGEVNLNKMSFPVICKPINGRSSQGIRRINNIDEWRAFIQQGHFRDYIVQKCLSGSVTTVDIIRNENSGKCVAIPRKEMLRTSNGAGTSVYVYYDELLEKACLDIASKLNINGCVNFEFIISDENHSFHFIECNPRFSGGVAFSCMTGYDCVKNHLACFMNKDIEDGVLIKNQYIARKYQEYVMTK